MSTPISDINRLASPFKEGIIELLRRAKQAGIPEVRVTETYRTVERQIELYNAGYSKTKTPTYHGAGHAADFYVKDYNQTLYNKLYELSKDIPYVIYPYYDLNWGWDGTHFQYDPNKKGADMLPKLDTNLWRYADEPAVNYEFPDEDTFNSMAGGQGRWDLIKIRQKPIVTNEVIKIEKVTEYVDKLIVEYKDSPETLKAMEDLKLKLKEAEEITPEEEKQIAGGYLKKLLQTILDLFK